MREMKKGISTIIATILLLIITIGLAGTAYMFISGMLTSKISKTISVLGSYCNGTHMTLIVANDGTDSIAAVELKVYINNQEASGLFSAGIDPHTSDVDITQTSVNSGSANKVLVISPSNSIDMTVWCP